MTLSLALNCERLLEINLIEIKMDTSEQANSAANAEHQTNGQEPGKRRSSFTSQNSQTAKE